MEWTDFISIGAAAVALLAAVAVLFRDRGSAASKLFSGGMVLFAAEATINFLATRQTGSAGALGWQELRYVPIALIPVVWIAFSLVFSRGNYREHLQDKALLLAAFAVGPVAELIFAGDTLYIATQNPSDAVFGIGAQIMEFILIGGSIVVLMNLEQTFRTAAGTQRWKIKLVLLGVGGLFLVRIYTSAQMVVTGTSSDTMTALNSGMLIICCALTGLSVVRTRDFSADLYPSQIALHRSVMLVLVGIYLVVVGLLSKLASFLGSGVGFELRALIILMGLVGMAMLLMSDRLRGRSRAFITRHFHRPSYNYQQVWTSFRRETASLTSTNTLCPAIARWISKTMNALSVTVWVIDHEKRRLTVTGSTLELAHPSPTQSFDEISEQTVILQSAIHLEHIINLDRASTEPAAILGRIHPRVFPHGGDRLAVPIPGDASGNIGVLIVGDRVDGVSFTIEDEELLTTVAEQASLELQAIRLSDELIRSREMEAFQRMSTFFVHDLKNTASGLSLMLQNLPKHFDNPDFRADALRSIESSVHRIKEMIQSLSALRRKLVVSPERADLSGPVGETIAALARERGMKIESHLESAGPVSADVQQIQRVLTNLVVNAQEASPDDSKIIVSTGREDGYAFIEVKDRGRGMTDAFVQDKLFQPFQSTKKEGTGIGLYHSKMIVDAHQGRMEVQSEPDQGTTFRVLLPLQETNHEADHPDRR